MAVVLSSISVIEHSLVDHLESNSVVGDTRTLSAVIECARKAGRFTPQLLDDADELCRRRNPFVHKTADDGERSLYEGYPRHEVHPDTLLEDDARFALGVMYDVFCSALRRGA